MKSPDSDAPPLAATCDPARVEQLFHAAADLSAADRDSFLARACAGDSRLEAAVRALLDAGRDASPAWNGSALDLEARHSAAAYHPRPGEFFGPYRIVRRISAGGMGFVYEAVRDDAEFHKRVAIKFVQFGLDDDAGVERFRSERQILAEFEHPHIARLLDGGTTDDGVPYLVMECVDGVAIDRFATERRLTRVDRLRLFLKVCDAVQYAHRNLVVHRDLKPGNILVTPDGVPKLLDFGIAKLLSADAGSRTSTIAALTPAYASPEQIAGRSVGTATDVYSLGVLLFVLLAGRSPYGAGGEHGRDLARAICDEEPVWRPAGLIQGDLRSILGKALHKAPERRYLSVEQFAGDIRRYLSGLPVIAGPDALSYRARRFIVRRAVPLTAATAIAIAIAAGVVSTLIQSRRAERRFNDVRTLAHSFLFEVYDAITGLPGSVAARQLVVSRAQQYLDSLASEAAGDSALTRELAEAYLRLGDVRGRPYTANLGDTAGALASYQKALALLERESSRQSGDIAVQEKLTQAYLNVGVILMRQSKADGSMAAARKAIAIAQGLSDREPHNVVYREKLAHAYMRLGQAQDLAAQQSGAIADKHQVLATYKHALAVLQADGWHDEEFWKVRLATLDFYVGYPLRDLAARTGDAAYLKEALDAAAKGDSINRQLAAAGPTDVAHLRRMADGLVDLAYIRWQCCRDLDGSLRDLQDALGSFQKIADRDAHNLEARRDVAGVHNARSLVLSEAHERSGALAAAHTALSIYEELALADPTSAENARCVADVRARIAAIEHQP